MDIFRIIDEKEDLALNNAVLQWKINSYEDLIEDILDYLCQEDVLAMRYAIKYKKLKAMEVRA